MTARTITFAVGLIAAASPLLTSAAAAQAGSTQSEYDRGYQAGRADAARANQGGNQAPPPADYQDQDDPDDRGQGAPEQAYQGQSYPDQGYQAQGQAYPGQGQGYQGQGDYDDADGAPPPPPPAGYDGNQPPPPPPGYTADPIYAPNSAADQRYEAYAEDWAARNCVRSSGNTATGAVIGGLFGALLGSSVAGYHNRGTGALVGGLAGAAGGAAVGSAQDNATSPGCPPGYVMRRGAPAFYYDGYGAGYVYSAPGWYRPWIFVGGRWTYRPYPYHTWYYRHYGWGRPGWRGGYRGGYRGGWRHRW